MREYTLGRAILLPEEMAWNRPLGEERLFSGEIGEFRFCGLGDLRIDAVRMGVRGRRIGAAVTAVQLQTPVGCERMLGPSLGLCRNGRAYLELGLDYQRVQLHGFDPDVRLVGAARMCTRLSGRVVTGCALTDCQLTGRRREGLDLSAYIYSRISVRAGCYASLTLHREGMSSIGLGLLVRPSAALRLIVAYDDAAELLTGMIAIVRSSIALRLVSGFHPVLGVTSGVALAWGV